MNPEVFDIYPSAFAKTPGAIDAVIFFDDDGVDELTLEPKPEGEGLTLDQSSISPTGPVERWLQSQPDRQQAIQELEDMVTETATCEGFPTSREDAEELVRLLEQCAAQAQAEHRTPHPDVLRQWLRASYWARKAMHRLPPLVVQQAIEKGWRECPDD